jgi:ubiquinone/menaquinone biosynthesis C-methylase UbiE
MNGASLDLPSDLWSEWLLHRRHADDPVYAERVAAVIASYVDRVLDAAALRPGMTLADVGAGEGLLAFRAIERAGPTLRALLTDISLPMLTHAEGLALQRGVREQCTFLHCPAEQLHPMADGSVDVLATRAVLAYVADKPAALLEFWRVLKPGGRISVAEPVFMDDALEAGALTRMLAAQPAGVAPGVLPLLQRWKAAQFPHTGDSIASSPIANTSERDLLRLFQATGFVDLHLELHIDVRPALFTSWSVFLGSSPHPWAPPLSLILAQQFSPEERQAFEGMFRPMVESGQLISTDRVVFVSATKPGL